MAAKSNFLSVALLLAGSVIWGPSEARAVGDGDAAAGPEWEAVGGVMLLAGSPEDHGPSLFPDSVNWSNCTGQLIHPRVILTAAHALWGWSNPVGRNLWVSLQYNVRVKQWPRLVDWTGYGSWAWWSQQPELLEVTALVTHPSWSDSVSAGDRIDVGLIILAEPYTDIEPAQLAEIGLVDTLQIGEQVVSVGYGYDYTLDRPNDSPGIDRWGGWREHRQQGTRIITGFDDKRIYSLSAPNPWGAGDSGSALWKVFGKNRGNLVRAETTGHCQKVHEIED